MSNLLREIPGVGDFVVSDPPVSGTSTTGRRSGLTTRQPSLSTESVLVLVALWLTAVCNSGFWHSLFVDRRLISVSSVRLALTSVVILTGIHILLMLPLSFRPILKPLVSIHLVGSALTAWFIQQFHVYVDTSMMRNVLQTDTAEVRELLSWSMLSRVILLGVLPSILVWLVNIPRLPFTRSLRRKLILSVATAAAVVISLLSAYGDYASFFRSHHETRYLITPENYVVSFIRLKLEEMHGETGRRTPIGEDARLGEGWNRGVRPVVFLLVVGETARSASFSLDGYRRDTNPRLEHEPGVTFASIIACGTSTADSLPCMFSRYGHDEYSDAKGKAYESLLDVLAHTGLSVVWLDNNSGCKGTCDGVPTEDLSEANREGACTDGECYDQVLVERTRELLEGLDHDLVLVLHQKGSHGPAYSRRHPEEFARFKPECESSDFSNCTKEEIRNAYDNSILYTDYILDSLITVLRNESDRFDTAMLYVSDHGESLGEGGIYLHGLPYALAPEVQIRVPMILWLSEAYAKRFSIDPRRLVEYEPQQLSHDHLFHTTLGLLDIETSERSPDLDLFSSVEGH